MGQFSEMSPGKGDRSARVPYPAKADGLDPRDANDSGVVKTEKGMDHGGRLREAGAERPITGHGAPTYL